ncbi:MAG: GNAT family N-acetyltransferase [Lutimonas sp.]
MKSFESYRLALMEVSLKDSEEIHALHSYPEVDEFNTLGIPKDLNETRDYLLHLINARADNPRKQFFWKIVLKRHGEFIGVAGLTLSADRFKKGEIYYKILPGYWGKGYATEAAKLLVEIGFNNFELHRIEAGVATQNKRSIRVLEKIGMKREGLRRKILPIRGEWVDNYHYAILENEPGA